MRSNVTLVLVPERFLGVGDGFGCSDHGDVDAGARAAQRGVPWGPPSSAHATISHRRRRRATAAGRWRLGFLRYAARVGALCCGGIGGIHETLAAPVRSLHLHRSGAAVTVAATAATGNPQNPSRSLAISPSTPPKRRRDDHGSGHRGRETLAMTIRSRGKQCLPTRMEDGARADERGSGEESVWAGQPGPAHQGPAHISVHLSRCLVGPFHRQHSPSKTLPNSAPSDSCLLSPRNRDRQSATEPPFPFRRSPPRPSPPNWTRTPTTPSSLLFLLSCWSSRLSW